MRSCVLCDATDIDCRWSHCLRLLCVLILPAALGKCGVTACTVWVGKSYSWSLMMYLYKHGHPPCAIPGNSEPILGTQTPPLVLQPSPGTPTIPWYSNPPLVLQPSPGTPTPIPGTPTPILVLQPPFVQATTLILTRHSDFGPECSHYEAVFW